MNPKQIERYLRENGFTEVRDTRHGTMWTDGTSKVLQARGYNDPRAMKNFMAEVNRAIAAKGGTVTNRPTLSVKLGDFFERPLIPKTAKIVVTETKPKPAVTIAQEKDEPMKTTVHLNGHAPKTKFSIAPSERKRYDEDTQYRVWSRVEALWKAGESAYEVTQKLEAEGFKDPDGLEPIKKTYIQGVLRQLMDKGRIKLINNATTRNPYHDPEPKSVIVVQPKQVELPKPIVTAPAIPTPPVKAYQRFSDTLINAMTDPEISDAQFRCMMRAMAGV